MPAYTQQHLQHFYWRAGFGPTPSMLFQPAAFDPATYTQAFLKASASKPQPLLAARNWADGLGQGIKTFGQLQQTTSDESRKEMRQQMAKQSREEIRNLNLMWLDELVNSPAQLREKMSLFWHGHFACRNLNSYYQQQLLNTIREHALGNFGDLLFAVSQSAAMLAFLNNQQNRKQSPNENFAREVMELFTMGRGHYSETDIKEAARAFTGWGFDLNGEFVFRRGLHDSGTKTILGRTGRFTGDDVLQLLLERKETASWICRKLYRFWVNETPNEQHVAWMADRFYQSGYQIASLLQDVFTASWFYAPAQMGARIKSPVELWVGIRRLMPLELGNPDIQLLLQRVLGQVLLYPPSVAGWPGGKNWIDSSSLLLRMRLPQLVALSEPFDVQTKADDDVNMGRPAEGNPIGARFVLRGDVNWQAFISAFAHVPESRLQETIAACVIPASRSKVVLTPSGVPREETIVQTALACMSMPEYQLC